MRCGRLAGGTKETSNGCGRLGELALTMPAAFSRMGICPAMELDEICMDDDDELVIDAPIRRPAGKWKVSLSARGRLEARG